jgi:hypothetical protein
MSSPFDDSSTTDDRKERERIERARSLAYRTGRTPDQGEADFRESRRKRREQAQAVDQFLAESGGSTPRDDKERDAYHHGYREGYTPQESLARYRNANRPKEAPKAPSPQPKKDQGSDFQAYKELKAQAAEKGYELEGHGRVKQYLKDGTEYTKISADYAQPKGKATETRSPEVDVALAGIASTPGFFGYVATTKKDGSTKIAYQTQVAGDRAAQTLGISEADFLSQKAKEGYVYTGKKSANKDGSFSYEFEFAPPGESDDAYYSPVSGRPGLYENFSRNGQRGTLLISPPQRVSESKTEPRKIGDPLTELGKGLAGSFVDAAESIAKYGFEPFASEDQRKQGRKNFESVREQLGLDANSPGALTYGAAKITSNLPNVPGTYRKPGTEFSQESEKAIASEFETKFKENPAYAIGSSAFEIIPALIGGKLTGGKGAVKGSAKNVEVGSMRELTGSMPKLSGISKITKSSSKTTKIAPDLDESFVQKSSIGDYLPDGSSIRPTLTSDVIVVKPGSKKGGYGGGYGKPYDSGKGSGTKSTRTKSGDTYEYNSKSGTLLLEEPTTQVKVEETAVAKLDDGISTEAKAIYDELDSAQTVNPEALQVSENSIGIGDSSRVVAARQARKQKTDKLRLKNQTALNNKTFKQLTKLRGSQKNEFIQSLKQKARGAQKGKQKQELLLQRQMQLTGLQEVNQKPVFKLEQLRGFGVKTLQRTTQKQEPALSFKQFYQTVQSPKQTTKQTFKQDAAVKFDHLFDNKMTAKSGFADFNKMFTMRGTGGGRTTTTDVPNTTIKIPPILIPTFGGGAGLSFGGKGKKGKSDTLGHGVEDIYLGGAFSIKPGKGGSPLATSFGKVGSGKASLDIFSLKPKRKGKRRKNDIFGGLL